MMRIHKVIATALLSMTVLVQHAEGQRRDTTRTNTDTAQIRKQLEQRVGRGVSQAEIVQRLKDAGLSRSEVRARLSAAGYDPSLADPYFDVVEGTRPRSVASPQFVDALQKIGLAARGTADTLSDTLAADSGVAVRKHDAREIFGMELFRGSGAEFDPVGFGPVDPGYRLGPGDQVVLVLTGDVELAYPDLTVTREGRLIIPDVGSIVVNGLTLAQLEDMLYQRLGAVYSGISRAPDASTRFQVSLGELRVNRVFVMGEVRRPASYQLSSVATTFNALYRAGGPTEQGSFRRIQIMRGGRSIQTVDLYAYLLRGDASGDIRLEHNDRIFVPTAERQVRVEGAVRRPATYEMLANEGVADVIAFAGGPDADAILRHIQIERVLPPSQRTTPGVNRTIVDVDLQELASGHLIRLEDGDVVHVFTVSDELRNRVVVDGAVFNPGLYQWSQGTTLQDVLARAEGLQEDAYRSRIHVYRLNPEDGTRNLIAVPFLAEAAASPFPLADRDSIVVLSKRDLNNGSQVIITGFIKKPDVYPLAEGMTLRDLILIAGGFTPGANVLDAEISRRVNPLVRTDTTSQVFRLHLGEAKQSAVNPIGRLWDIPDWPVGATDVVLQDGDQVAIRRAPGFEPPRTVTVVGEVTVPGVYSLRSRDEKLAQIISRAGGPTTEANIDGLQVKRGSRVIAGDLSLALRNVNHPNNIVLEANDSIMVPRYDPTVAVSGGVAFNARVLYRAGKPLSYYIDQAGGYSTDADKSHVSVQYPNGERATVRKFLLYSSAPDIRPGALVYVPTSPPDKVGFNWDSFLSRTLAIMGTVATLVIATRK
jgi:protein involved in polysaccharide export with SLBB domain